MAKKLLILLEPSNRPQWFIPSEQSVIQSRITATLLRLMRMVNGGFRGPRQNTSVENYASGKSREDECRLEFQRFMHW